MSEESIDKMEGIPAKKKTVKKKTAKKKTVKKKAVKKKVKNTAEKGADSSQMEMDFLSNDRDDNQPVPEKFSTDDSDDGESFSVFKSDDKVGNESVDVNLPSDSDKKQSIRNEATAPIENLDDSGQGNHHPKKKFDKNNRFNKNKPNHNNRQQNPNQRKKNKPNIPRQKKKKSRAYFHDQEVESGFEYDRLLEEEFLDSLENLESYLKEKGFSEDAETFQLNEVYNHSVAELIDLASSLGITWDASPNKEDLLDKIISHHHENKSLLLSEGVVEIMEDGHAALLYEVDNYKQKSYSIFIADILVKKNGILPGHQVKVAFLPGIEGSPYAVKILSVMGTNPEEVATRVPFTELTPYYPTDRIVMEGFSPMDFENSSMRIVDLISPIGFGQRSLIVAPPRTGKTVLMQSMAKSIRKTYPDLHLIILLVDERPEEVTDFRRQVDAEVIASTFDENAESHVHAAEVVIEKARRMVEAGENVAILLDSITRLARAYNTSLPNSGKILSGGVEANALQRPKRFFGSARNIEGGGSLTIIGTALVETGSKMDEVIFEEFKGTGNMELHLDRAMSEKRIYPALSMDKSGTRKEELLYHPEELNKVYSLRRAMKGVPPVDAMESLIQRVKKAKTNAEFLMTLGR